jgi:hypothetical protein
MPAANARRAARRWRRDAYIFIHHVLVALHQALEPASMLGHEGLEPLGVKIRHSDKVLTDSIHES